MSPEATVRGVATRRIRRRARIWHAWQFPDPSTLKDPAEQLREAAKARQYYNPRPALTKTELRTLVDEARERTVKNFRISLRELRRETSENMRHYYREQIIKWLGNLRRWPEAEAAFTAVAAELQEYDL